MPERFLVKQFWNTVEDFYVGIPEKMFTSFIWLLSTNLKSSCLVGLLME